MKKDDQKVVVEILGGLGNQMFQYAAGYALARRRGAQLLLDLREMSGYELRGYLLHHLSVEGAIADAETLASLGMTKTRPSFGQRIRKKWLKRPLRMGRPFHLEPAFHFDEGFFELRLPVFLRGYFQSDRYFEGCEEELRRQFFPAEPLSSNTREIEERIERSPCPISVHIRRGDYVTNPKTASVHGQAGIDYYERALRLVRGLCGSPGDLFFFSDDPAYVIEHFGNEKNTTFVTGNDERPWEDMYLMARCSHHVLANSSFSWWGAWLNPDPEKVVVAPRAWFQRDRLLRNNTVDLIPHGWYLT